jgi:hypothetical protein
LSWEYNTVDQDIISAKDFLAQITSGQILKLQYSGGSTNCQLLANDSASSGTTKPSIAITIIQIA